MMDRGRADLVVDPYQGFTVVFTDPFGNVVHRTMPHQSLEVALMEAAQWLGKPMTIELKQIG